MILELPVVFEQQRVRDLNPCHWALLRSLSLFTPGARPSLDELARRLGLREAFLLEAAWQELVLRHAVDDPDFAQARLSFEGKSALEQDFLPLAPATESRVSLYFDAHGKLIAGPNAAKKEAKAVEEKPAWVDQLTPAFLEQALRRAQGLPKLTADTRLSRFSCDWQQALWHR